MQWLQQQISIIAVSCYFHSPCNFNGADLPRPSFQTGQPRMRGEYTKVLLIYYTFSMRNTEHSAFLYKKLENILFAKSKSLFSISAKYNIPTPPKRGWHLVADTSSCSGRIIRRRNENGTAEQKSLSDHPSGKSRSGLHKGSHPFCPEPDSGRGPTRPQPKRIHPVYTEQTLQSARFVRMVN